MCVPEATDDEELVSVPIINQFIISDDLCFELGQWSRYCQSSRSQEKLGLMRGPPYLVILTSFTMHLAHT